MADELTPAFRNDNVGHLARRLIGDDENPPDFTAAPLLCDALREADEEYEIPTVCRAVMAAMTQRGDRVSLEFIRAILHQEIMHLMYDFTSLCGTYAVTVQKVVEQQRTTQSNVHLKTVRAYMPDAFPGQHCQLSDGRSGVVVSTADGQGYADVLPTGDGPDRADSPYGLPPMTNRRIIRGR